MVLRVVGAGLPRTGTRSLSTALSELLGEPCYHMSEIPGHPFDLGDGWRAALRDEDLDWTGLHTGYAAAVDWPTSLFWPELSEANPDAVVLLSRRTDASTWWQSLEATILPYARQCEDPSWEAGRDLAALFRRFAGTAAWDDRALLERRYDEHLDRVRAQVEPRRLVDWQPGDGWEPICDALRLPVPRAPFPHRNRREEWG